MHQNIFQGTRFMGSAMTMSGLLSSVAHRCRCCVILIGSQTSYMRTTGRAALLLSNFARGVASILFLKAPGPSSQFTISLIKDASILQIFGGSASEMSAIKTISYSKEPRQL